MIDETNSITEIIDLDELNAETITLELKNFFIAKELEIKIYYIFCSDGAATLIGKKTGVVKRFQKINPFITSVHCIAHRLHLAGKDAAKHVPYFNHYETCSYQRDILEDPQLTILNIVNTRWLSMSNTKNLLDELDYEFVIATKYLADLMFILMKLINIFQREFVSFSAIKIYLDTTYDAITAQFIGIDEADPHMSELGNYGNQEIEKLSAYYGVDKFDSEGNIIERIINSYDTKQEWAVSKYYLKQIRGQDIVRGWEYIFN
ncbi:20312_t:CDS:2, partial [Gigaspora rosea]